MRRFVVAMTLALWSATATGDSALVWAADAMAASVGVNVHLHYTDTPYYSEFATLATKLATSKIRWFRDGVVPGGIAEYFDNAAALSAAGMSGLWIVPLNTSGATLTTWEASMGGALDAYEGPNEHDLNGGSSWATDLAAYIPTLWGIRHGFPMFAPSLTSTEAYDAIGSICANVGATNLHNYFDGRHPETGGWGGGGYASITYQLANAATQCAAAPVMVTESGWYTDSSIGNYVSEAVHAKYTVRLLLEQFRRGITRTWLYEAIDFPGSGTLNLHGYGLLRSDMSEKPAFVAVSKLLALLEDQGTTVAPAALSYTLTGGDADVRDMALQKRNGTYLLALWDAKSSWDLGTSMPITNTPQTVTLALGGQARIVATHTFGSDGTMTRTPLPTLASADIAVTDTVQFVEVQPARVRPLLRFR